MGRGLQALPCLDLCQQLRVVSGGGHHVEGFSACRDKDGDGKLNNRVGRQYAGSKTLKQGGRERQKDFLVLHMSSMENVGQ